MIAPSEKHLEDWIVDNSDWFGEAFDADIFPDYISEQYCIRNDGKVIVPFSDRIVARQLGLPAGIPDLIMADCFTVAAVEIKKGPITYDTVGQCLRYIHELKQIFYWAFMDVRQPDYPESQSYIYTPSPDMECGEYPHTEISGMVVGHSISDKNIPIVCAAAGIRVITYDYDGQQYLFETNPPICSGNPDDYRSYLDRPVGVAIREVMRCYAMRRKNTGVQS